MNEYAHRAKEFIGKYKHAWILSYFFIYMAWFMWLENNIVPKYWMKSPLDDLIPFVPAFIIPYTLWFAYVASAIVLFLFISKQDYFRLCAFLFIGMSIILTIYMLFPNGHRLRPQVDADGLFLTMIARLHDADTSTNVAPSIHVYNSIGVHIALAKAEKTANIRWLRSGSFVLMLLIIMSTVFLKQHSIDDIFFALPLCLVMYIFVYKIDWSPVTAKILAAKRNGEENA
ncbi:MAG: hypothetical protein GX028_02465 [Clostridiaceae bacterium]|nr:hypothetical protein [Clostridiaceae bacterium]